MFYVDLHVGSDVLNNQQLEPFKSNSIDLCDLKDDNWYGFILV